MSFYYKREIKILFKHKNYAEDYFKLLKKNNEKVILEYLVYSNFSNFRFSIIISQQLQKLINSQKYKEYNLKNLNSGCNSYIKLITNLSIKFSKKST